MMGFCYNLFPATKFFSIPPANVVKVSNKFRYKLIIKCKNNRDFRALLSAVMTEFGKNKEFGKVSTYADMNALTC